MANTSNITPEEITARKKLMDAIVKNSVADTWDKARNEWTVTGLRKVHGQHCVCGQKGITNCYTIKNRTTGATLYPIGSDCI